MKYIISILIAVICLCPVTLAQVGGISASAFPRQTTVAQLPVASSGNHGMRIVTDGASNSDCTVGGSTFVVVCLDTGSTWSALGSGSGSGVTDHGLLTGLEDDDHTRYHDDSRAATWLLLQSIAWSQLTGIPDLATQVELDTHEGNANIHHTPTVDTDDQIASEVGYDNTTSGLTAVEVQSAIDEIVSEMPSGSGDVTGPAITVARRLALFADTTGDVLGEALWTIDVNGKATIPLGSTAGFCWGDGDTCMYESVDDTLIINSPIAPDMTFGNEGSFTGIGFSISGNRGGWIKRAVPNSSTAILLPTRADNNTGVGWAGAGDLRLIVTGSSVFGQTVTETTMMVEQINSHSTQTCTDSADTNPGFLAITVSGRSNVEVTQADVSGGCTASLSESGATRGQVLVVSNVSNAGGTLDFADSAGVQETGAGCSLGLYGIATFRYIVDRWILQSCVPTN